MNKLLLDSAFQSSGFDCVFLYYSVTISLCVLHILLTYGCQFNPPVTDYYNTSQQILISCILSVSVLILVSSIIATVISLGYPREKMEFLRHFAVFNIVSCECPVILFIMGFLAFNLKTCQSFLFLLNMP